MTDRTRPYTQDEKRVCKYIRTITQDVIGCGDDPIGFLIASHNSLRLQLEQERKKNARQHA